MIRVNCVHPVKEETQVFPTHLCALPRVGDFVRARAGDTFRVKAVVFCYHEPTSDTGAALSTGNKQAVDLYLEKETVL